MADERQIGQGGRRPRGRPRRTDPADSPRARVLHLLATTNMDATEIAMAVGCNASTVTRAIDELSRINAVNAMRERIASLEAQLAGCTCGAAARGEDAVRRMRAEQLKARYQQMQLGG